MPLFTSHPPMPSAQPWPEQRTLWAGSLGRLATRCAQILLVVIVVGGITFGLSQISVVVIPVLLALIVASAMLPVVDFLRRIHVPSILATWITLVLVVGVLGTVVWLVVLAVERQANDLVDSAIDGFGELEQLARTLPVTIDADQLASLRGDAVDFVTSRQFGVGALAGVSAAGSFATAFAVFVVVLFFFLKDGPRIWDFLCRPFHGAELARAQRIGQQTVTTLGGYIRGTATVAVVDAVGIGIGLAIIGVPLALPLAVIVFVFAFIPLVGATLAGLLAAVIALVSNGPAAAVWVIIIVFAVNQIEGNFLQPVVMGRTLKLHPLVILIALTIGTITAGVIGAILAVPLAAVAWGIVTVWRGDDDPAEFARQKRPERMTD
ncbi:AI-2E family transporter [Curtobacterium sp. VKM Ac-1393]|uniref:AI-2E family transporter n=1 Tax=Curtobacterium sp. VKM Ac-1393 TaxID=2783814 RepID=UPI00188A0FA5|nr:AI-2E family transporter [Curtobacterium sp. VKM Ac-1393]MBF4607298.1 AI-2E family transporter [Curtobacterium sp. VKM Ac-1393]